MKNKPKRLFYFGNSSWIKKGTRFSPKTEIKIGEHKNIINEFKKGEHKSVKTEFQKGRTPWNKGLKGIHLSPNTEFKKGQNSPKLGIKRPNFSGNRHPNWKGGTQNTNWLKHLRRMRERNVEGTHSLQEWQELKMKYNFMCLCCKRFEPEIRLTIDHIIPLIKGGSDYISNIQPLCISCNSIKHDKFIDYRDLQEVHKFQ